MWNDIYKPDSIGSEAARLLQRRNIKKRAV